MSKTPEGVIQLAILKHLRAKGIFCWRNNTMGLWDPKLNLYRSNPYAMPGAPDIICISPCTTKQQGGVFVGIEVKTPQGKQQSADQLLFEKRCATCNAEYHVVKSLDEMKKLDYLWR